MPMDDGERCRGIGPAHEGHVDARLEQQTGEQAAVLVVRERPQKRHGDPEATERNRGVERSAAGDRAEYAVFVDEVDEGLASDDDHGARSAGGISPDPRAISLTGTTWCTDGDVSPSSRLNRRSAADRPSACGSCATTETAGSRTSASATSSKPISAIRRSSRALLSA